MAAPRKDNVKDIILDVTENLLNSQSIDDISLAQIATEAGISKGTLYYHYKNKESILFDIADRYLEQQKKDLFVWVDDKNKDTSLHRLIKYVIEYNIKGAGPRIHLIYNACLGNEDVRDKLIKRYTEFQKIIRDKIAERIGPEHADYLSWLTLLISDGIIVQEGMGNDNLDPNKFIEDTDAFFTALNIK